jgi:YD repeat-containing protein
MPDKGLGDMSIARSFGDGSRNHRPSPPEGGTHETSYAYNLLNQMTTVTMPRNTTSQGLVTQTRTFNDSLTTARLTSATNPENGTVSYTYNADGTLAQKTDAKNQQIQYTYDTYGRVTEKRDYASPGSEDLPNRVDYNSLRTIPPDRSAPDSAPHTPQPSTGAPDGPNEQARYRFCQRGRFARSTRCNAGVPAVDTPRQHGKRAARWTLFVIWLRETARCVG